MTTNKIPFEREDRYIVIKISHLHCADALINVARELTLRNFLDAQEIIPVEAVVVEADWPEYEPVWKMIEARCGA